MTALSPPSYGLTIKFPSGSSLTVYGNEDDVLAAARLFIRANVSVDLFRNMPIPPRVRE
jgi:hypothetical protein